MRRRSRQTSDLIQKEAAFDAAQAALLQAKRQLAVLAARRQAGEAQRAIAQAQLDLANANLSRTVVVAPFRGRVTELTAAKGTHATPGQALMLILPLEVWVTANFRETQLADMRPGQPAEVCIDAYARCFRGHVDSIQASLASTLGQIFPMPAWQRITLVAAGAGAGIAATFNTPIRGVVFAVGLMLPEVSARTFLPVALATGAATFAGRIFFGWRPAFDVPANLLVDGPATPTALLIYALLGALAGLAASRQMDEPAGPAKFELMCWQCGVNPDPPSRIGVRAGSIAWKLVNGEVGADTGTLDRAFGFSSRTPVCHKTPCQRGASPRVC